MAHTINATHSVKAPAYISQSLTVLWNGLVRLGENSARARLANQIGQLSETRLKELGVTRAELIKRVFSDGYHM